MRRFRKTARGFCALLCLAYGVLSSSAWACTGIQVEAKDSTFVNGRTVEFGMPIPMAAIIVPRNYSFNGTLPNGSAGMAYRSKYAAVGGNSFGESAIVDGL